MPDSLAQTLEQLGGSRRLLMIVVGVGALGVLWAVSQWAMSPSMVPLFNGLPVEEVGSMTQRLTEEGIEHELQQGGSTIAVAQEDLARARVSLAQEGYPAGGKPGWELFDQAAWGMTDFTQRVNYRRALEGELGRTIAQMRSVESAQVHLAIRKSSVLRREEPSAEASVVLALDSGSRPEAAMVEGVASLVAGSVEGLERENVTVLDDSGRLLSNTEEDTGTTGLTSQQLTIQREMETHLEEKAYELVEPVVGRGNVTVRVAAALDFDQIGRTVESYNLDEQVTVEEDRSEIIPGTEEQGASSVTVNSVFDTPRSVETYARTGARVERITVAVVVNARQGEEDGGGAGPRPPEELTQVEAVVRNGLGISPERGDAVTVVSLPFDREPLAPVNEEEGLDVMALLHAGLRPTIGLVGLILAFVLALRILGALRSSPQSAERRSALPAGEGGSLPASEDGEGGDGAQAEQKVISSPQVPKVEITDPEMTARVVKAWMREE
jgi:flagellar M-ring protein FliF